MPVRCDDSRYPILVIHFEPVVLDADLHAQDRFVYPLFERMAREKRHGVLLVNNAPEATLTASQRRMVVEGNKRHDELLQRTCLGIGIVMHSSIQRGIFTATSWLMPSPVPMMPFGSLVDAERWARERLRTVSEGTS